MKQLMIALACGVLFGLGLSLGGMTNPDKVLNFMDILGDWDPTLLFVFGGAVGTTLISFRFVLKRPHPIGDTAFSLPTKTRIDKQLVFGAILFGIGWGLLGFCPGPAIVSVVLGSTGVILALSMLTGHLLADKLRS